VQRPHRYGLSSEDPLEEEEGEVATMAPLEVLWAVEPPLITAAAAAAPGAVRKERSKSVMEKLCFAGALPRLESRICSSSLDLEGSPPA